VLSIAPQSLASLSVLHDISPDVCFRRLRTFFKRELGFRYLTLISANSSHSSLTVVRRLVFDTTFARTISIDESQREWSERAGAGSRANGTSAICSSSETQQLSEPGPSSKAAGPLPILASSCPGWICYAEKTHGELLPYVSAVKSPQQVMGTLVKHWLGPKLGLRLACAFFSRSFLD
jgi:iron only hydrogenase large subunit-like protein